MSERIPPAVVATMLGVTLAESSINNGASVNGSTMTPAVIGAPEPIENLGHYPYVVAAMAKVTGDRSEDTARIIGACIESMLTLDQTRWAVDARSDLAERLAGRHDDDVGRVWHRIDTDRRKRAQSEVWAMRPVPPVDGMPQATEAARPTTVDGATFILDEPDTIPALWGNGTDVLWPSGEALMIAGGQGLGKTTAAGQLVGGLLFGGDMLGLPMRALEEDDVILFLAMDRPRQAARSMGRQFGEEHRDVLARRVRVWKGPPHADIAANPALLLVMAQSAGARVVFVDSVKDAAIGLSADEVGAGWNRAVQLLLASGRELCELHHTVKRNPTGGAPSSAADIYGSVWLTAGCGSVILLTGEPGDPIIGFRHIKQPAEEVGPFRLFHDQAAGRLIVDHVADLVALVKAAGSDGLTAKAAASAMFDKSTPTRAEIQKARRKLDDLVTAELLTSVEGGKGQGNVTAWFAA